MRGKITKSKVDRLQPGDVLADEEIKGFVARKLDSGAVTYGYRYRAGGKQRWLGLGLHGSITADEARALAKKRAGEVANERDPMAERRANRAEAAKVERAESNTVNALLDSFVQRYVHKLRSATEIERTFDKYVRPLIGSTSIYELKRRQIVEMLNTIEDKHGPVMADRTLAHVRKAFNWHMVNDEEFQSPIIRGMARTKPAERARSRILSDDEIREVWAALEDETIAEPFRRACRTILLTAQRPGEVLNLPASEIEGDTWRLPSERAKNKLAHDIFLTPAARKEIGNKRTGFLFSSTAGKRPYAGEGKAKAKLNKVIADRRKAAKQKPIEHWTLQDLRRTARSLLARAGVPDEVGELIVNHKRTGVLGTYNRHDYAAEKRAAWEKLAGLLTLILNPPKGNVVKLAGKRR